ncbi:MAG: hypothetical protein ACI4C4_04605 [Lachnospiraceae bacterium]
MEGSLLYELGELESYKKFLGGSAKPSELLKVAGVAPNETAGMAHQQLPI